MKPHFYLIIGYLLLSACNQAAQVPPEKEPEVQDTACQRLRQEVAEGLALLDTYSYWKMEDFDVESFSQQTAEKLSRLLACEESDTLKPEAFNNLEISAQSYDNLGIQVFNFVYSSGGTRGAITTTVIRWKNRKGGFSAFSLASLIWCRFDKIYRLPGENLYMLTGTEQGNSSQIQNIAYVLQFRDDTLVTDYPAFANRPFLNFSNTYLKYDEKERVLIIKPDWSSQNFPGDAIDDFSEYSQDTAATERLSDMLSADPGPEVCEVRLVFDGKHFNKVK